MPTYSANRPTADGMKADGMKNAPATRLQKVVIVNSSSEILTLAERALTAGNYDVIFVEAMAHAYSQIRRVQPNLVILCLRISDMDGFQLLSMLKLDPDTREIPILTYAAENEPSLPPEADDETTDFFAHRAAALMN